MAATGEDQARLLVSVEATMAKYQKQMASIAKSSGDTATGIEQRFKKANDNAARSFDAGARRATASVGQTRAAVSNLSFQLNDIAMGLASGTSPFTIMVQQGSQVSQALQGAGGGLVGAVKALGGAFATMINPVSLVSFALIGAAGYAVQYFTEAEEGGEDVNNALQKQADLLRKVANAWGDQLSGVRDLANELDRISDLNDQTAATAIVIGKAYEPAKEEIAALDDLAQQVFSRLRAARFPDDAVKSFSAAWNDLQKALAENKATAGDAQRVINALTQFPGAPKVDDLTSKVRALADQLGRAAEKAAEANTSLLRLQQEDSALGRRYRAEHGIPELPASAPAPEQRVDPYFEDPRGSMAAKVKEATNSFDGLNEAISRYVNNVVQAESGGNARAKNPLSSATGLGQFIESTWLRLFKQEFPDRAKGMADATILALRNDAEISRSMIEAYAKENAALLRQAGIAANEAALHLAHFLGPGGAISVLKAAPGTPIAGLLSQSAIQANPSILGGGATVDDVRRYAEERAKAVDSLAQSYRNAKPAVDEFTEAQKQAQKAANEVAGAVKDALGGLIRDLISGKDASEALSNALGRVADKLLQISLDNLFSGFGGGGKGGLLGGFLIPGILHSGGVAGRDGYGHGRAVSPSVFSGAKRYHSGGVAGLQPGEIPAILQRGEVVLPKGSRLGGPQQVVVRVVGEPGPMFIPTIQAESKDVAVQVTQAGIGQYDKQLNRSLASKMANAQMRQG